MKHLLIFSLALILLGCGESDKRLLMHQETELMRIARKLALDLESPVQIEFVSTRKGIYIVQLRLLNNHPSGSGVVREEEDILHTGKSFSAGCVEADKADVLIVESDCESHLLIGKKALIVREDVEFSHVLVLSKSMNIPSIYAVGDIELGETIKLDTNHEKRYILK